MSRLVIWHKFWRMEPSKKVSDIKPPLNSQYFWSLLTYRNKRKISREIVEAEKIRLRIQKDFDLLRGYFGRWLLMLKLQESLERRQVEIWAHTDTVVKWVIEFLTRQFKIKADLLQLNSTQFPSLGIFIHKTVRNWKN